VVAGRLKLSAALGQPIEKYRHLDPSQRGYHL